MKMNIVCTAKVVFASMILIGCAATEPPTAKLESNVNVSKTIAQENTKGLKRVVAIARFSNETKSASGFFVDENNDRIGKQASDILSSKLASTNKFIMLERSDLDKILTENDMSQVASQKIPADYLIIGSVSEFGRKTESDVGVFSRTKKQIATATVNIRLIDTKTGEIVFSEEATGESVSESNTTMGVGGRAAYDSSLNDSAISAAISKMTSDIVENLLDKPWRAFILDIQDGMFVISGGESQGISAGDKFQIVKRGKQIKNPQTGMLVELPGKPVGKLTIAATVGKGANEVSMGEYTGTTISPDSFSDYYVEEAKL